MDKTLEMWLLATDDRSLAGGPRPGQRRTRPRNQCRPDRDETLRGVPGRPGSCPHVFAYRCWPGLTERTKGRPQLHRETRVMFQPTATNLSVRIVAPLLLAGSRSRGDWRAWHQGRERSAQEKMAGRRRAHLVRTLHCSVCPALRVPCHARAVRPCVRPSICPAFGPSL